MQGGVGRARDETGESEPPTGEDNSPRSGASSGLSVTEICDDDYRSIYLPCQALEEAVDCKPGD